MMGADEGPALTLVCTRWHRVFWAHGSLHCQLTLSCPQDPGRGAAPSLYDMDVAAAEKLLASKHALVARLAPRLAGLTLRGGHAHRCGAWDVPQLLRLLPEGLPSLELDYCSPRVAAQCQRLTGLTRLHLGDSLSAQSATGLLSSLPRLRCLRLTIANWTAPVAASLARQTGFTQLSLRLFGGVIPLLSAANYSGLASLSRLNLWCYEMPAATLGMLAQFAGLTSLQLSDNPFDLEAVLEGLPALPRLRLLALHPRVSAGGRHPLPAVQRQLARFPALTDFEYRNTWRPDPSGIAVGPALLPIFKFSLSGPSALSVPAEGQDSFAGTTSPAFGQPNSAAAPAHSMPSMALELQVSGLHSLQSLLEAVVPPGVRLHSLKLLGTCLPEEALLGCAAPGQLAGLDLEACHCSLEGCAALSAAPGDAPASPALHDAWCPAGTPALAAC
ncbi:hypothetical protein ABPG75_006838 [Micractinium tetrahymenae]